MATKRVLEAPEHWVDSYIDLSGKEWQSEEGMRVRVVDAYQRPDAAAWYAMHQDYCDHFATDDPLPYTFKEAIPDRLLNKTHFGPLEHVNMTLNIGNVSRSLMAQITRHRTGISFDIQSLRYTKVNNFSVDESGFIIPPYLHTDGKTRERFVGTVQINDPEMARTIMLRQYENALDTYKALLSRGMPGEDARYVLPLGIKIFMVMTCNVRTFMHLFDMRLPANAQWEIRSLCETLLDIGKAWMPTTYGWYEDNRARKHKLAP